MPISPLGRLGLALALIVSAMGALAAPAQAEGWIEDGKVLADLRARYEHVKDDNCTACAGRDAEAATLRLRLGLESGVWKGFSALVEIDQVWALGDDYNDTRNGRLDRPVIGDPEITALNRLQLTSIAPFDTKLTLGRQRIVLGNQRFVGNVGWRQHEQTFDALSVVNTAVEGLTVTYAYIDRVNRVFGEDDPVPAAGQVGHFDSASHVVNAVYTGLEGVKLEGFGLWLDLAQDGPAPLAAARLSTATLGMRADAQIEVVPGWTLQGAVSFAHQSEHADNPLAIDLDYWTAEAGLSYAGVIGLVGYEVLEGDGTVGFSTPLATLHAFNGWADVFLTTPPNGLSDLYLRLSVTKPDLWGLKSVAASVLYHDFEADRTGVLLGQEWDVVLDVAIDGHVSVMAKYAAYDGAGHDNAAGGWTPAAADKQVGWLMVTYKY